MELHSYPTVFNLEHRAIEGILDGYVHVQEKIDGSQMSFCLDDDGTLLARSKRARLYPGASGMFQAALDYLESVKPRINGGLVYRAEYLQKPKHNVLSYSRVPKGYLVLFDIEYKGEDQAYVGYNLLEKEAGRLGIDVIPMFYEGEGMTSDELTELLKSESILGGTLIEGVVVKNYSQFTMEKKIAVAKVVATEYKEVHSDEWRKANPTKADIIEQLITQYATPIRWQKAVQNMRDDGNLVNGPQDIGPLLVEINQDILKEEADTIKDVLFKHFWKQIGRGVTRGFPEWYKEQLSAAQP